MTLRTRLLVGLLAVGVVLVAASVLVTRSTEAHLTDQVDNQLRGAARPFRRFDAAVGVAGGSVAAPGNRLVSRPVPPPDEQPARPSQVFVGVVSGGDVQTVFEPNLTDDPPPAPIVDIHRARKAAITREPFTTTATDGSRRYRVLAQSPETFQVDGNGNPVPVAVPDDELLIVAVPLDDVDATVARLVRIEVAATLAILGVLGVVAWWVVHLGLRPIRRMTETATAIAGGDLSHRVPDENPSTEAGALGAAMNHMLGRIEEAFGERDETEQRLRRFVADASHELRTPLATIRGFAELHRLGGLADDEALADAMRRTEQESVRMTRMVEDLLQLARYDQGRPVATESVDVAVILNDAAVDAAAVEPGRSVTVDVEGAVVVLAEEDALRQAVANLVSNVFVHTPPGTPVTLRATRDDRFGVIEVADTGPGMSADEAASAFDRFYRADPSRDRRHGGSGLGLAIVRTSVEAQGGTATLTSEPDVGTTVRLELPLAEPAAAGSGFSATSQEVHG